MRIDSKMGLPFVVKGQYKDKDNSHSPTAASRNLAALKFGLHAASPEIKDSARILRNSRSGMLLRIACAINTKCLRLMNYSCK